MKWGDNKRDHDTILAVWPSYEALRSRWQMTEFAERDDGTVIWRDRRVPGSSGGVKVHAYTDSEPAFEAAASLNDQYERELGARVIDPALKRSLQLKVSKGLQAKKRLQDEEALMLAEAKRRHAGAVRPTPASLLTEGVPDDDRADLLQQLQEMPYLRVALVGAGFGMSILEKQPDGVWKRVYGRPHKLGAERAWRGRIANGFDLDSTENWGSVKAKIRSILLPRANKLLQLASVRRLLDEALARGERVLVCNSIVFWYEEDGHVGWQVKSTGSEGGSDANPMERRNHSVQEPRTVGNLALH